MTEKMDLQIPNIIHFSHLAGLAAYIYKVLATQNASTESLIGHLTLPQDQLLHGDDLDNK